MKRKLSATEAAKQAAFSLGLDDVKRVGIALAAAAADEVSSNARFAEKVRLLYSVAPASAATTRSTRSTETVELVPLKPVPPGTRIINPAAPLDPYFIYDVYGVEQLPRALALFPLEKLKEATAKVEQRNPGTKPKSRGSKAGHIDYIVAHIRPPHRSELR